MFGIGIFGRLCVEFFDAFVLIESLRDASLFGRRIFCVVDIHKKERHISHGLKKYVLLCVRNCEVLAVARLRLEDDFDAFKPFQLLAEEHNVHKILQSPQIRQLKQLSESDLIAV